MHHLRSLFFCFVFYCVQVFCLQTDACNMCTSGARRSHERVVEPVELVTDGCEIRCGSWKLNQGPLKGQPVLLATAPSLQPPLNLSSTYLTTRAQYYLQHGACCSEKGSGFGDRSWDLDWMFQMPVSTVQHHCTC